MLRCEAELNNQNEMISVSCTRERPMKHKGGKRKIKANSLPYGTLQANWDGIDNPSSSLPALQRLMHVKLWAKHPEQDLAH